MIRIRSFRTGDEAALADICLRTADAGADATGVLDDDAVWAEIFVLPYVARHPESAFVVETDDGRIVGYAVAVPDTAAFETWFRDEWWPEHGARWPKPDAEHRESAVLVDCDGRVANEILTRRRSATADPLQLAIYRQAWAELHDVPVERVRAAFYYVRTGELVEHTDLEDRAALEKLLSDG